MKNLRLIAVLAAVLVIGSCKTTTVTTTAPDDLDIRLREASTYLNGRIPQGSKVAFISIQSDSQALSEYIIDDLIANAVNDGLFSVVDRQQLDAARAELNFNMSGEVSDESAQSVGRMLGAQTIVTGRVSRIGNTYRLNIRALEVETVQLQGSENWDIAAGARINALVAAGGSASSGGTAAAGSTSGGTTQASAGSTTAQTPIASGTYSFYPRPRAMQSGVDVDVYIDRIVVRGGYFNIYFASTPVGRGSRPMGTQTSRWYHVNTGFGGPERMTIQDLDNPRRTWNPVNSGVDDESGGVFLSFQGVTARRFTFSNGLFDSPVVFEEIVLGEPD